MTPRQLSLELRRGVDPDLTRRRWIIGISLLGTLAGQVVALYQTGIIRRLPDLPMEPFDSNEVSASNHASQRMQTPAALPMIVSLGLTACLAAAGGINRARTHPALPIALGVKTLVDVATTAELGREEWKENRALCAYCQATTLGTIVSAVLALPEALKAMRHSRGR